MNTKAACLSLVASLAHGSECRTCKNSTICMCDVGYGSSCAVASQLKNFRIDRTRARTVPALRPAPSSLRLRSAPIGIDEASSKSANTSSHLFLSEVSASCLAVGPWNEAAWYRVLNLLGFNSDAITSWSTAVRSSRRSFSFLCLTQWSY